ncbi:hypothetical protein L6164_016800 [Bauhinia variegata]|uniref:Uncharacterized protein n=1 Tax=Bauhinia variegata TaxID=167791 RepID=A0ACB9N9I4_BAUVA|nr:hypothetical protein L6164_016800 [Bauhinia variegata]
MASSTFLENSMGKDTACMRAIGEDKPIPLDENVLQKHVAFFDKNKDGVIYPWETYQGLRKIGCDIFLSFAAAISINLVLSLSTRPGKFPSPLMPIEVKNIQLGKHGSDTGVYAKEGRFVPSKFEEIFCKHAKTHPNALTSHELNEMLKSNREPKDLKGWIFSLGEWRLLYSVGKDKNGLLQKETVRGVYDGSLFERLEAERKTTEVKKNK